MENVNDIVNVTIALESPAADIGSFGNMLLVVPEAAKIGTETMPEVAVIKAVNELTEYGYTVSDAAYTAATVAFQQDPNPGILYVIARKEEEEVEACLDRALVENGWYGFCLIGYDEVSDIQLAAKWAEANGKLFGLTYTDDELLVDISGYENTFAFFAGRCGTEEQPEANQYAAVAMMSKCFGYEPGAETWNLKTLDGITPSKLTTARMNTLKSGNINFYTTIAGRNVTREGKVGSGEWIDVIRFKYWLLNEIQYRVFTYMARLPKIPFNDEGITGIQNVIETVLAEGQKAGGIDVDRYDEDENLERGYTVSVPLAVNVDKTEKRNRKLKGVTFTARLAGAIHETTIKGTLVY